MSWNSFRHRLNKPVSSGSVLINEVLDKTKSKNFSVMTYVIFFFFLNGEGLSWWSSRVFLAMEFGMNDGVCWQYFTSKHIKKRVRKNPQCLYFPKGEDRKYLPSKSRLFQLKYTQVSVAICFLEQGVLRIG